MYNVSLMVIFCLVVSGGCTQRPPTLATGRARDLSAPLYDTDPTSLCARGHAYLSQLPGVVGVICRGNEGFEICTDNPAAVPSDFEGAPVEPFPAALCARPP